MFDNLKGNIKSSFYLNSLPTPDIQKYNPIGTEPLIKLYFLFYSVLDASNSDSSLLAKNKYSRIDLICLLHCVAQYCNVQYNKIYDDKYKEICRKRFANYKINFDLYFNPSCRSFKYASQVLFPHTISPTSNLSSGGVIPSEIKDRVSSFEYILLYSKQGLSKLIQFASNIICYDYINNTFKETNSTVALINPIAAEGKVQLEVSSLVYSLLDTISVCCKECVEQACNMKFSDNETISFEPISSDVMDKAKSNSKVAEIQRIQSKNESSVCNESEMSGYIYCPKCGAKLPNDSIFCMKCGAKIPEL